jgi:succinate dehydrogenase/fumarate reductase flavoprotein subunit
MGNALVAQLLFSTRQSGIDLRMQTLLVDVERFGAGWRCVLEAKGHRSELLVRRGLVIATGGFSGDEELRRRWLPELARAHSVAFEGNSGGGLRLGQQLGGTIEASHVAPAFWMPVSTSRRPDGSMARFPHIMLDRAKPGLLAVDSTGRRFVNEADAYHHFCEGMLRARRERGATRFFLIADRAFVRTYGLGMIHPGLRSTARFEREGYLLGGPTPDALAARLRLDAGVLAATLVRYNEDAACGVDAEWGRGESVLNRHNGDPGHTPNPCLRPLDLMQLVAMEVAVADLATSVGLATDADARVLDARSTPIEGLYACGNDMASIMRGAYPGPGTTLGPGMAFAWRAARHLAGA